MWDTRAIALGFPGRWVWDENENAAPLCRDDSRKHGAGWDLRWGGKETKGREPHKPVTTVDKRTLMPLGHSERKSRTWLRYPCKEVGGWVCLHRGLFWHWLRATFGTFTLQPATRTWVSQVCSVSQTATPQTEAPWTTVAAFSVRRVVPRAGHCGILLPCPSWHAERRKGAPWGEWSDAPVQVRWRERHPCS